MEALADGGAGDDDAFHASLARARHDLRDVVAERGMREVGADVDHSFFSR